MTARLNTPLSKQARTIAEKILDCRRALVASHIDADGISAASIASSALENAGIEHEVIFLKKLDDAAIEDLRKKAESALVWLTDLGSAFASRFAGSDVVITDHHQTESQLQEHRKSTQTTIFAYGGPMHLNPFFFGFAGARDISGAGLAFLVAYEMDERNKSLVHLPVIGAIGDIQDLETRKLIGLNAKLVDFGVKLGALKRTRDLRFFGLETRSLQRLLEFASDPYLPGLSNNPVACDEFLKRLKIETMRGEAPVHWSELADKEKHRIISELSRLILENGGDEKDVERLTGEVYIFPSEPKGSPTREAREFATLLNSCGRNDMPELGLEICKGDRGEKLSQAFELLKEHRENLSNALMFVRDMGITAIGSIQYFHCADQVKDTILGAIVGILLGSGEVDREKPLVGLAISQEKNGEYKIKASVRTTYEIVSRGVNLAVAIKNAASAVGGIGGGHNIAAGATLPLSTEEEFLRILDNQIRTQLQVSAKSSTAF